MGPFQAPYVVCRLRVFDPKARLTLESRLCSLFVLGLAVKNSASVEIRIETICDHAAQKICDRIDDIRLFFRCVLEAVPDALLLAVFDGTNGPFVPSMM